ncbi:MAG: histidine kinase [Bacteroidales bacterium]|nr:histidine kinase [Bacteroidales bacterium]
MYRYQSKIYFTDLDNDLYSECVCLHYSGNNSANDSIYTAPAIQIDTDCSATKLAVTTDQINLSRQWPGRQWVKFGDFNNDSAKEIYFFTWQHDSLFLNIIDPARLSKINFEVFIDKYNFHNQAPDVLVGSFLLYDMNNDGFSEIIGSVVGAYSALPRFVFIYDIKNDVLKKSKTASISAGVKSVLQDKSGNTFLSASNYAPQNVKDSLLPYIDFTDHSSWLVVLNQSLDFVFPPIENRGFTSTVHSILQLEEGEVFVYAFFRPPRGKSPGILKKYDLSGNEIYRREFSEPEERGLAQKTENNHPVLYFYESEQKVFYKIDKQLGFSKPFKTKLERNYFFDIDFDGSDEIFNWQEGADFAYLYRPDFSKPAKVDFKNIQPGFILSPCRFKDNSANFSIYSNNFVYFYTYFENPVHYLRFPLYLGIYLLVSFVFFVVMYFQKKSLQAKFEQEKRMTELELLTIKNQMDPHFTFNVINTASYMVYNKDKKTAYRFLVNFSNLIRSVLQKSKEISVQLSDEIEFVKNYLVLQQYRYDFSFDYEVTLKGNIDQTVAVPKMIIQTFVENAIKHGLAHKKTKGQLDIIIDEGTGNIILIIQDNGIGRKASKEMIASQKISTGKGHDIINQIIQMFNKLKKTKVTYKITDLYNNENDATGTRVKVQIPIK